MRRKCGMRMGMAHGEFFDILEERRRTSDVDWVSRHWYPTPAYIQPHKTSAALIKDTVFRSKRLYQVMKQVSDDEKIPFEELGKRVIDFLDEMGYSREMPVIRWASYFTLKILKRVCSAIFVNEAAIFKMKTEMGRTPIVFIPSHRSYADFILMSFMCFAYDLELPRIAAGMDFQSMAVMGQMLRDCCAFFMRRTFSDNKLYSATFCEYVQALVTHGDAPLEFFIEGTRSRTGKALVPKFGFLSMVLKPFLTGLVHDISIVPVNVSYERILEEVLFAYELLGIPKPKESTRGFIKAMSILKEDYGASYVQFGSPVSVKEYMEGRIDSTAHSFGPIELQDLTPHESKQIVGFAYQIVNKQQALTILSCSNVLCTVLTIHLLCVEEICTLERLSNEILWLIEVLQVLGATVSMAGDLASCIRKSIDWHHTLLCLHGEEVRLRYGHAHGPQDSGIKNRGANLSASTMDSAIPFLILQSYVNPGVHYFSHGGAFVLALKTTSSKCITNGEIYKEYVTFRQIFAHEFVYYYENEKKDFQALLSKMETLQVISVKNGVISLGENTKLQMFLVNVLCAFIPAYVTLAGVLLENAACNLCESELLKLTQEKVEKKLEDGQLAHPANLSLDVLVNGIHSFAAMGALDKLRSDGSMKYATNIAHMGRILAKLELWENEICTRNIHQLTATMASKL